MANNQNKKSVYVAFGKIFANGGKYYQSVNKGGEPHGLISGLTREDLVKNMSEALYLYNKQKVTNWKKDLTVNKCFY